MKYATHTALAALLCSAQALAAQSSNVFEDPIAVEVLQGWERADGSRIAALRLTLKPGWKTYWRAPGDAGIPPQFSWSGSRNLDDLRITWPQPYVFHDNGMRSIGYKNQVVIPLHIAPKRTGQPVQIKGRMDLGVCSDICMPHTLRFSATLEDADSTPTPAIAASLATAPYSAAEAGVKRATCVITPSQDGMRIETRVTMPSAGGPEETVIEPGVPGVWVSEPKTKRDGRDIVAVSDMVHPNGGPFSVNRANIRITVIGSGHAVDIQGCTAG